MTSTTTGGGTNRNYLFLSGRQSILVCFYWLIIVVTQQNYASGQCIQNFQEIYDKEELVTDTTIPRMYVVCPNTLYEVGHLDFNYNLIDNEGDSDIPNPPIPLRSNMNIRCGDDGRRSNLCWIMDGDLHMDGTTIRDITDMALDNIVIEGFVFMSAVHHSLWATKAGSITFRDCEWMDHTLSKGLIMMENYDDDRRDTELVVQFENCRFHSNRYFGKGAQTSLVMAISDQNRIVINQTLFDNNDMTFNNTRGDSNEAESNTFLIESLGPISIVDSCFLNNLVHGSGVAVYGNTFVSTNVHYSAVTSGALCEFASVFETIIQYQTLQPSCVAASLPDCTVLQLPNVPSNTTTNGGSNATMVKQYVPFAINALRYDKANESDTTLEGGCNRDGDLPEDGPDAQNTEDDDVCLALGGCFISHTVAGEYLIYRFGHYAPFEDNGLVPVDVTVRVSSASFKAFTMQLLYKNDTEVASSETFITTSDDFDVFEDITWQYVPLRATESIHSIKIDFTDGGVNLCSISADYTGTVVPAPVTSMAPAAAPVGLPVAPVAWDDSMAPAVAPVSLNLDPDINSTDAPAALAVTFAPAVAPVSLALNSTVAPVAAPTTPVVGSPYEIVVPGVYSALYYTQESELDIADGQRGSCTARPESFVDAQENGDAICAQATNSFGTTCHIAFTEDGEFLVYDFRKDPLQTTVTVTLRTATKNPRLLQLVILSQDGLDQIAALDFSNPSTGPDDKTFDTFTVWDAVDIGGEEYYKLRITFVDGSVNLCTVGIE